MPQDEPAQTRRSRSENPAIPENHNAQLPSLRSPDDDPLPGGAGQFLAGIFLAVLGGVSILYGSANTTPDVLLILGGISALVGSILLLAGVQRGLAQINAIYQESR